MIKMTAPTIEVLMGINELHGLWLVTGPERENEIKDASFNSRQDALAHAAERAATFARPVIILADAEH